MTLREDIADERQEIQDTLLAIAAKAEAAIKEEILAGEQPEASVITLTPAGEISYIVGWRNEWEQAKVFSTLTSELASSECLGFVACLPGLYQSHTAFFFHSRTSYWSHTRVLRYRHTISGVQWGVVESYPEFSFPHLTVPTLH